MPQDTPSAPIRVLIADDHPVVRQGLAAMLTRKSGVSVVGETGNGREVVELFRRLRPDVTLMDLRMPQMDGGEAIARIRAEFPAARILVLTTYDTDEDIYQALRVGAMGFLLKDTPPEDLLEAIRAVHAGRKRIPPAVAEKLSEHLSHPELTARELEVLRLIAAGQSNKEIGTTLFISESTVRAHLGNILNKLSVSDRTQAAVLALRRGLVRLE
ncbi:MAG: response regulator transcription factor [Armatimonadetes bacterium]|nr:response regulator transcription factor [Armatimonadota bacterium]